MNLLVVKARGWAPALLVGTMLVTGACDGGSADDLSSAIVRARYDLESVNPGGAVGTTRDARAETYVRVAQELQAEMGSGTEGEKASANLLIASANHGLARIAAAKAREADIEMARLVERAFDDLRLHRQFAADARSLRGYDPASDLATLDDQIADLDSQIQDVRQEISEIEQNIADKRARAEERLASARKMRDLEQTVRGRLVDAPPEERGDLATEANRYSRQADEHEREAAWIQAEIDRILPRIDELNRRIASLQNQRESLRASQERIREQAEAAAARARDLEREAEQAASAAQQSFQKALDLFEGPVTSQFELAIEKLGDARSRASSARSRLREAAGASLAAIEHDAASFRIELAQSASRLAEALASVETADTPATAGLRTLAGEARGLRDRAEQAIREAGEALQSARSAYQGISARGEAAEQLTALAESLERLRMKLAGEEPEAAPEEESGPVGDDDAPAPGATDAG